MSHPHRSLRSRSTFAAALITATLTAPAAAATTDDGPMVEFSLVAVAESVPPGGTALVGLRFQIEDGWHVYWEGRNDTGFPIMPTWTLPEGWTAGSLRWPAPHRYIAPGDILDYVYEDEVTLLLPITAPADASEGETLELEIAADWLVCREACIPEDATASITLTVDAAAPDLAPVLTADLGTASAAWRSFPKPIAAAFARLPRPGPSSSKDTPDLRPLRWADGRLIIEANGAPAWTAFYPAESSMNIADPINTGKAKGPELRVTPDTGSPFDARRLTGIVEINHGKDKPASLYWIDEPVPGGNE